MNSNPEEILKNIPFKTKLKIAFASVAAIILTIFTLYMYDLLFTHTSAARRLAINNSISTNYYMTYITFRYLFALAGTIIGGFTGWILGEFIYKINN